MVYLWIQAAAAERRLKYGKVAGASNPADMFTKPLVQENMLVYIESLNIEAKAGRAESAPRLQAIRQDPWFGEESGDLVEMYPQVALAHCVSCDPAMGRGIAQDFKAWFGRPLVSHRGPRVGTAIAQNTGEGLIFHLVTKQRYFEKPEPRDIKACPAEPGCS